MKKEPDGKKRERKEKNCKKGMWGVFEGQEARKEERHYG